VPCPATIHPSSGSDQATEAIKIIYSLNQLWANFGIKLDHKTSLKALIWIAKHDKKVKAVQKVMAQLLSQNLKTNSKATICSPSPKSECWK
jgi:hypothetical protein